LNIDLAINTLVANGWAVADNFFDVDLCKSLRKLIQVGDGSGLFKKAGIGRGKSFQIDTDLRADFIKWLDDYKEDAAIELAKNQIENLRVKINRSLFLGLTDFEGHLTYYPPGTGYAKHVDRFLDNSARTLSFVTYLNEEWCPADGGMLRIYDRGSVDELATEILPISGRTVIFLSDEIHHAVSPNSRPRYSLTGWYRR